MKPSQNPGRVTNSSKVPKKTLKSVLKGEPSQEEATNFQSDNKN